MRLAACLFALLLPLLPIGSPASAQAPAGADPAAVPSEAGEHQGSQRDPLLEQEDKDDQAAEPTARLIITSDAPCRLWVAGEELGLLEPEADLETEVQGDQVVVRAVSTEAPGAVWTRTVDIEEGDLRVEIKMAKAVRERYKLERREKVWAHFKSGLMWAREDNRENVTWRGALGFCERSSLGGWKDWRLPTIEELHSLQAKWSLSPFKIADQLVLSACCAWSSSEIDQDSAWNFSFRFRQRFEGRKEYSLDLRALCVRRLTLEELQRREEAAAAEKKKRGEKKPKTHQPEDKPR